MPACVASRLARPIFCVALALAFAALPPVAAQPVRPEPEIAPDQAAADAIDLRKLLEDASDMDLRLTKQIMLLQKQINDLRTEVDQLRKEAQSR